MKQYYNLIFDRIFKNRLSYVVSQFLQRKFKEALILKLDISEDEIEDRRKKFEREMSLSNSLFFAFAGLMWQSPESVPRAPSSRIPASLWYMIGVITVTSYTANLVAIVNDDK